MQLRKAGASYKGLCPFHGEKTPSFQVHGDRGFFHCFGCGVGGDVIKFVELFDKMTFPEAVRQLAARFGLPVPEPADGRQEDEEGRRERESLLKAHEVAASWFREQLGTPAGAAARRQLKERGLTSPYLRPFVVARINPIRFSKSTEFDYDDVVGRMAAAAAKFNVEKVKQNDIAKMGGPPPETDD